MVTVDSYHILIGKVKRGERIFCYFGCTTKKAAKPITASATCEQQKMQMRGLEPLPTLHGHEPESCAYANSATSANCLDILTLKNQFVNPISHLFHFFFTRKNFIANRNRTIYNESRKEEGKR